MTTAVALNAEWARIHIPSRPVRWAHVPGMRPKANRPGDLQGLEVDEGEEQRRRHEGQAVVPAGLDGPHQQPRKNSSSMIGAPTTTMSTRRTTSASLPARSVRVRAWLLTSSELTLQHPVDGRDSTAWDAMPIGTPSRSKARKRRP